MNLRARKLTPILLLIAITAFVSAVFIYSPTFAAETSDVIKDQLCSGNLDNAACASDSGGLLGPDGLVTSIINTLSLIVGIVSVISIIIGAIRMTISGGDGQSVASARNQILYSLIGVVVALVAQGLVNFVIGRV